MEVSYMEGKLYELTLASLTARLHSEDCTAADINAARAFIKDHGIQGGKTMEKKEEALGFALPKFDVVRRGEEIEEDDERTGTDD